MKTLRLNKAETAELNKYGYCEIERNGFCIAIEKNDTYENGYSITIINPYEKVTLTEETEQTEETIEAAEFDERKYHIYDVKTTGKHPVHLISGGDYITEDERYFGDGDMGIFYLNQKEYDLFKSNVKQVALSKCI